MGKASPAATSYSSKPRGRGEVFCAEPWTSRTWWKEQEPAGPSQGESIWGEPFSVEATYDMLFDREGLLAYANRGPNSNASQFFITAGPAHHLDMKFTIFGEVVEGMDAVKRINNAKTGPGERPLEDQKLIKAYVKE